MLDARGDATFGTNYQSNNKTWTWGDYDLGIHGPGLICKVEGCINYIRYHDILEENVHMVISKFNLDPSCVIFQQDNAPIHTTMMLQD